MSADTTTRVPDRERSDPSGFPPGPPGDGTGDPMELLRGLTERLARMEGQLAEVRAAVVEKPPVKELYSIEEAARVLGKSKLTVREHCRFGRIAARKRQAGRGATSEWAIPHAEIVRVQNEGLLPLVKHVPDRL